MAVVFSVPVLSRRESIRGWPAEGVGGEQRAG